MESPNLYALVDRDYYISMAVMDKCMLEYYNTYFSVFDIKPVYNIGTSNMTGDSGTRYTAYKLYHDKEINGEVSYIGVKPINGDIVMGDFKREKS